MPIQLIIRPYQDKAETLFAPGELRTFEGSTVRLGSGAACECSLPSAKGLAAEVAVLALRAGSRDWELRPAAGVRVEVGGAVVTGPTALSSGDHIRCGDWLVVFRKVYPVARHSRRADALAIIAKVLLFLVVVVEIGAVSWLPQRVNQSRRWERDIARQRVAYLMDEMRLENSVAKPQGRREIAARKLVGEQLDDMARYLRANQEVLDRGQWRRIQEQVDRYEQIMTHLRQGTVFEPLPAVATDEAVKAVLKE